MIALLILAIACASITEFTSNSILFPRTSPRNYTIGSFRDVIIQAVDASSMNLTSSPTYLSDSVNIPKFIGSPEMPYPFSTAVVCSKRKLHNLRNEIFDRGDGTFLIRVHDAHNCKENITVSVFVDLQNIVGSPLVLPSIPCPCPMELDDWIEQTCDQKGEIDSHLIETYFHNMTIIRENINEGEWITRYVVKNNRIYRRNIKSFTKFSDQTLLMLSQMAKLPDMEFGMNVGDWPKAKDGDVVFSWCGSEENRDIIIPTWVQTKNLMHAAVEDHQRADGTAYAAGRGWNHKLPILFWRGRDSRQERVQFVREAKQFNNGSMLPEDVALRESGVGVDVGITSFSKFKHFQDELGLAAWSTQYDFQKYKYLMNIDGTVAAYRLAFLLAGDSVVLLQETKYYEHYYKELEPWVHYIPVKADLSDWREKLLWAAENDDEAQTIAMRGRQFVRDRLAPEDILCYHAQAYKQYASRME